MSPVDFKLLSVVLAGASFSPESSLCNSIVNMEVSIDEGTEGELCDCNGI